MTKPKARHLNQPECPLRFGEPCTLCQAYVSGPEDCQTVALVMSDPELRTEWMRRRRLYIEEKRHRRIKDIHAKEINSK